MREIIGKVDYDFHSLLTSDTVEKEKIEDLWSKLNKNSKFIITNAIEVVFDKKSNHYSFLAPCICYMILTHKEEVDSELYNRLVNRIILNDDLGKIQPFEGISFLQLLLADRQLQLNSYTKLIIKRIKDIFSRKNNNFSVVVYPEIKFMLDNAVTYTSDDFEVGISADVIPLFKDHCYSLTNVNCNDLMILNKFFMSPCFDESSKSELISWLYSCYGVMSNYIKFLVYRIESGLGTEEDQAVLNRLVESDRNYIMGIRSRIKES